MKWDLDEWGNAIDLQITYREIVRRGWHGKHANRIPPIWRNVVAKVIAEHHREEERRELMQRFGSGQRQVELRERLARADEATRARQRERRER